MTTKERIRREIETLPDEVIHQLERYIHSLKKEKPTEKRLRSFKLQGQFDTISIREAAHESAVP